MTGILWLILSYLLGSFPSGFLISRFSGKDVLKIGWRKTSGSNVFKNVGKWQGVLTGILDVAKGYLAIYGAQRLGFPLEVQIFSGVAAVTGHNWSCFLKFAGGRGIGTFIGAFFALSPQILGFSLIPLLVLAIVWTASIGTLLFLTTAIFLAWYFNQFEIAGIFTLISLAPILIKRLSPIREVKNFILFRNRLIFDNDEVLLSLRIKRIFKKTKGNPVKIGKAGWQAAKFGVKIAKKPIEKLLPKAPEKVVTEIRTQALKKMMIAAAKKIVLHQEEINKINVFPVADKDTGYNLAATLLGIEGTISPKEYPSLRELTEDIKEAAMTNARGNAGMIYTGYLMEVLDRVKHLETIDAFHLALAMKRGIKAAYLSIADPVEGTILDVIKAAGERAWEVAKSKKEKPSTRAKLGAGLVPHRNKVSGAGNIIKILDEAYKVSEIALKETKEKLEVLKKNDVVDAGALGFVKILEAWTENLKGFTPTLKPEIKEKPSTRAKLGAGPVPHRNKVSGAGLKYRYEVVLSFKKTKEIEIENLKKELSSLGDSLDIIELADKIKIHIHTNQPGAIKEKFKDLSEIEFRVEDMEEQLKKIQKKPLGLVVDEIADLPKEFLEKYEIEEVPFKATSAPSFKEFLSAYQRAFKKFEQILVITVSSKLFGTYSSARIARSVFKKPKKLNIFVFDCFTAEVAEGLIIIKTQELISQGKKIEEILNFLKEFCPKVTLLATVDDFRYIVHGGRVKLPKILIKPFSLIQKIGVRPLIILKNGKIKFSGIRFGKNLAKILAKEINRQRNGQEIRVAIAQADNLKAAEALKKELEKMPKVEVLFISSVSSVVRTHTGPGALLVAFHSVDI